MKQTRLPYFLITCLIVCLISLVGCTDEEQDGNSTRCDEGEVLNPILDTCDRVSGGDEADAGNEDAGDADANSEAEEPDANEPDAEEIEEPDANPDPPTGLCEPGMDPSLETECSFYAHSSTQLYLIDPFRETIDEVRSVPSGLFDIDTHPDGTLYGITEQTLYKLDQDTDDWTTVGSMGQVANANGLCINLNGTAYLTAHDGLYEVDLATATVTLLGNMGPSYTSSGDCVIDKGNRLFMSANSTDIFGGTDNLTLLDPATATGTMVGDTGYGLIYGLTAAWDLLIGTTGNSEVILIDRNTGESELLFVAPGNIEFYGAASTPAR